MGGTLAPTICQILFLCNDSAVISDSGKHRTDIYPPDPNPAAIPLPCSVTGSTSVLFLRLSCDPSIIPIPPWRAVLFRLIASPPPSNHQPLLSASPQPPSASAFPLLSPYSLSSAATPPPSCWTTTSPTTHLPQTASAPPLLDSIPPLPAATPLLRSPSFPGVTMHHAISYRFVTFRFSLGIHNPLHVSPSVFFLFLACRVSSRLHEAIICLSSMSPSLLLSASGTPIPQRVFAFCCGYM